MTTEINVQFPIGLLQMSIKFTNEPPQGIRASLKRTYADVTQDTLDYSNHPAWPLLLYSVAFLHTVVQVRICQKLFSSPLSGGVPKEARQEGSAIDPWSESFPCLFV